MSESTIQKRLVLSTNPILRYVSYFLLYFSQGIPIGLWTIAIPGWLAFNGATAGDIGGFIGLAMLPWAVLKLFYGVFMDRYTFAPMGRKRIWLIGAQAGAILSMIPLVIFAPGIDELAMLTAFAFLMNVAITIQDVAVDGIAVDVTPEEQRVQANAVMFAGQIIGTGVAAAVAGLLLKFYGIAAVAICFATFLSMVLTVVILVRERPGERMLPWTDGKASLECLSLQRTHWLPLLKDIKEAFLQPRIFFLILAIMSTGIINASLDVGAPMYASEVLEWDETGYSTLAGIAGIVAGLLGMLILGRVTDRLGSTKVITSFFMLIGMPSLIIVFWQPTGFEDQIFQIYVFIQIFANQCIFIGFCALAMNICLKTISATQFSILIATSSVARVISSTLMGGVYEAGGIDGFWITMTLTSVFGLVVFLVFNQLNSSFNPKQIPADNSE